MKEIIGLGILCSLRKLRVQTKISGFSLVEVLVAGVILSIIFAALSMTLTVGDLSNTISLAKLEAQSELRKDMDWIVRDLRQTDRQRLNVTDMSDLVRKDYLLLADNSFFSDPQFNICTGYDVGGNVTQWSGNRISYVYNNTLQQITRTDGSGRSWVFNNITAVSFEKIDNTILRLTLTSQIIVRGTIAPTYTLEQEVTLRNG